MDTVESAALLVMAAGLGRRFGGDKQMVNVGPNGETFFDFAIRDALRANLEKIVLVIREELDDLVQEHLNYHYPSGISVNIVHQDTFGPIRAKPWGTAHAVLCAADFLDGPTVVINADDYYGKNGIPRLIDGLNRSNGERGVLLAFELSKTLPSSGLVSRGVCMISQERLLRLVETHEIQQVGEIISAGDPPTYLLQDTPVSMNLWGLPKKAIEYLNNQWRDFYAQNKNNPAAEFLLPTALDEQIAKGLLEVEIIRTDEQWIGVTNPEDLETARLLLKESMDENK